MKNINWKKRMVQALWLLIGTGTIVLFGAAIQKKNHRKCTDVKIEITGAEKDVFIDEKDVLDLINSNGNVIGKDLSKIDLKALENAVSRGNYTPLHYACSNKQEAAAVALIGAGADVGIIDTVSH